MAVFTMQQFVPLTGIARLAAEGSVLHQKRRVEYRTLPTRKWLNRCHSHRVPFDWTLNPYRGCEFGCKYCYARFTHEFLERREDDAFETEIYAKDWNPAGFREELRSVKPGQVIAIGTATDPYQPAERKFLRTKALLNAMADLYGNVIYITTKSNLIARDAKLLQQLAGRNRVGVTVTVTTLDGGLARLTEPYAPRPDLRLAAVAELARQEVPVSVMASPVLPLITDSRKNLESIARAAKQAGAREFGAHVVFLQPCAQRTFFPFLAEHFPEHLARYEKSYAAGAYLKGDYPRWLRQLVEEIRTRNGLSGRSTENLENATTSTGQMLLF